jgi:hypothetical protein
MILHFTSLNFLSTMISTPNFKGTRTFYVLAKCLRIVYVALGDTPCLLPECLHNVWPGLSIKTELAP